MDFNRKKLRLGDVLVNSGVITAEQLQKGLELQRALAVNWEKLLLTKELLQKRILRKH